MGNWSTFIISSDGRIIDKIKFKNMHVEFNRGHLVFHEEGLKRTDLAVSEGMLSYKDLIIIVTKHGQCSFFILWSNDRGVVGLNRRNIDDDISKKDIKRLKKMIYIYRDSIPRYLFKIDVLGIYNEGIKKRKNADIR